MKIHRFIGEFDLTQSHINIQDRALVHQIFRVLKLKEGEEVVFCDGKGMEAKVILENISEHKVDAQVISLEKTNRESSIHLTLYASILKHESFDLVVQKATELGVYEIVPVIVARTVKHAVRLERLRQIAKEAAEQSGRGIVPQIFEPINLGEAFTRASAHDANFFFEIGAPVMKIKTKTNFKTVGLFVGPEGGWDEREVDRARKIAGCKIVGLGQLTLRAETAVIVASYLVLHATNL